MDAMILSNLLQVGSFLTYCLNFQGEISCFQSVDSQELLRKNLVNKGLLGYLYGKSWKYRTYLLLRILIVVLKIVKFIMILRVTDKSGQIL